VLLVLAEEADDGAFSTDDELNLSALGISLRIGGLVGVVGDVVTIFGGLDNGDAERDLVRGKKCLSRAETE
jgi:hypothetical protein